MARTITYCDNCDEQFNEVFDNCSVCGDPLQIYEMDHISERPPANDENEQSYDPLPFPTDEPIRCGTFGSQSMRDYYAESGDWDDSTIDTEITQDQTVPHHPLEIQAEVAPTLELPTPEYGGIGRLVYFLSVAGLAVFNGLITSGLRGGLDNGRQFISLALSVVILILIVYRMKNIGKSGWWALLWIVPLANIWVGYVCLTQQEGFEETKELDGAGRTIRGIFIGFWVLVIIIIILGLLIRP